MTSTSMTGASEYATVLVLYSTVRTGQDARFRTLLYVYCRVMHRVRTVR
jgi:hypothetical protein